MSEATAEQEAPSKAEVRRSEETRSPVQRAMTQARYEIKSHEQDLLAEGVTKEQIESAAERAGKRVEVEYKEKEGGGINLDAPKEGELTLSVGQQIRLSTPSLDGGTHITVALKEIEAS